MIESSKIGKIACIAFYHAPGLVYVNLIYTSVLLIAARSCHHAWCMGSSKIYHSVEQSRILHENFDKSPAEAIDCIRPTVQALHTIYLSCLQVWSSIWRFHQFDLCHLKFIWQVKVICHFTSHPESFTAQTSPLMSRWKSSPTYYWFKVKKLAAWL